MVDINHEHIFIPPESQIRIIDAALESWQRQIRTKGQDYCIIWLSGSGGLGKSTLLRHYYEKLSLAEARLHAGKIIDWSDWLNDTYQSRYLIANNIDETMYHEVLYRQFSWSLERRLNDFKAYKTGIEILKSVEERVSRISGEVQKIAVCDALWKITREKRLKILQWFAHLGLYGQNAKEMARQLGEYIGEDVKIDIACIQHLYEKLSEKLGERFDEYLQSGYILGAALGRDLQRFARERPLLIFFDSYECIEKGDRFLENVMATAGTQVGWCIAGRSQAWANVGGSRFSVRREHRREIALPDVTISLSLQARGMGSFSSKEVAYYFAKLCEQKPSIPAINEKDAEKVWEITQGIPLAVNLAGQLYTQTGNLETLFSKSDGTQEVIEGMVERYLLYVPYASGERIILYGLAMLRRTNDLQIIRQLADADINWEQLLEEHLRERLHTTHAIFIARGQVLLHQEVRHFLRQWLLSHWGEPARQEVAQKLQIVLQARIHDMEKRSPYQRLNQRFEDDAWVHDYLDLVEAQFWIGIYDGLRYCLPLMLASVIYRRDILDDIVAIGNFFRASMALLQRKQWDWMVQGLLNTGALTDPEAESRLEHLVQMLSNMQGMIPFPFTHTQKELEGALYWKRAEMYQEHHYDKAVYWYQEATRHIENCEALSEEAAHIRWRMATNLYEHGKYNESLEELKEVLRIKHDFSDANYSRGEIYRELGEYNKAIIEYQYAIALDDHHISAHINLGNTYLTLTRYQEAIDLYSKALLLEPNSATLYFNRALAHSSLRTYEQALADYNRTIALQPDFAEAYTGRAMTYAYLRNYEQALTDYNQACQLSPLDIHITWNAMWANLGDQPLCESAEVETLIQLDPEHYIAYICRALSLALRRHELPTMQEELQRAILMEPDQWDHYFWQGMIYCYYGEATQAQDAFEKALEAGLPPLFLKPLYWLKDIAPHLFEIYAAPLLADAGL